MSPETALLWSWLNVLSKKRYDALMKVYGALDAAVQHLNEELLRGLGCRQETIYITLNRAEEFDPDRYQEELQKRNLQFISIEDDAYPSHLREIGDPPVFLYARGDLEILDQPCIALVGTRDMTPYGSRVTEMFVPPLVRAGVVTVSGLALGIDAAVASETLVAGGKTVAVLGHGLGNIYPKSNALLAEKIVKEGGLLLSEFPLDIAPDKYTFPARNRIIAGLSLATVVLEAGEGSGALITADLALDYSRDVFAVPGQIFDLHAAGCHKLIARGSARLVTAPEDILQEVGIVTSLQKNDQEAVVYMPQTPEEEAILRVLTTMPQSISALREKSGLATASVNAQLTMMELAGVARNLGDGTWVRR